MNVSKKLKPGKTIIVLGVVAIVSIVGVYILSRSHAAAVGMSVSGNRIYKDGAAFTPRGFNMIGALAPPGCTSAASTAATHYGDAELTAAQSTWKSNTLRMQVSQGGMDPQSTRFTAAQHSQYMTDTLQKIQLARAKGLVVIVSMQDQSYGCGKATPMPSSATTRAWQNLAPKLAGDPYVMLEVFNEPQNEANTAGWNEWKSGGVSHTPGTGDKWTAFTSVGHQTLVNTIRSAGAPNVILLDGAKLGEHMEGIPLLNDPSGAGDLAYATHPYYYPTSVSDWDVRWGNLSAKVPVVATEWNYQGPDCGTQRQTMAPQFFTYMKSKNIGIMGHALDVVASSGGPQNLVATWTWTPTKCGTTYAGGGQDFKDYLTSYPPETTPPPPPPPGPDLTLGRIIFYNFENVSGTSVPDTSGTGNPGTLYNFASPPLTETGYNGSGKALKFNRSLKQRIGVGTTNHTSPAASLKTTKFTISSWIKINENDTDQQNWEVAEKALSYWFNVRNGNDSTVNHSDSTDPHYVLRCGGRFNNGTYNEVTGTTVIPHGTGNTTWSHVACTYDGATLRIYLNGALEASKAINQTLDTNDGALVVGGNDKTQWAPDYYHEWMQGAMDDFMLYNRALSVTEISMLAQNDAPTPPPPPPADTTPPVVSITSPAAGATISGTATITGTASDNVGVTAANLRVDDKYVSGDPSSPYSFTLDTTAYADGTHTITLRAFDAAGNQTDKSITVTIKNTVTPLGTGDANGDSRINALDLSIVLSHDGQNYGPADFNHDGTVGSADLAILLGHWTW